MWTREVQGAMYIRLGCGSTTEGQFVLGVLVHVTVTPLMWLAMHALSMLQVARNAWFLIIFTSIAFLLPLAAKRDSDFLLFCTTMASVIAEKVPINSQQCFTLTIEFLAPLHACAADQPMRLFSFR